ncbi:hypothetical protein L21SP3_01041 [Sedimentisphaera cyanobacteriorum]|uniref:SGNH hydrolase-type esterase domain-containing protein n=1 Tax=Sedimentisphaera cyanobacteriorum TaxID=1940790 RepID=A0A1Q2HP58_9BACT|nr:SGNH/GDSL hydrolase family protein [Sedimentisphaera cyanobacteriorum]AQQ09239.1 hypothetical protein L21SP3_01041 [Sedimentisphaera cyanobacteriorum]
MNYRITAAVLFFAAMQVSAYQVFLHLGHSHCAKELINPEGWQQVAQRADGVWGFDAWTRTLSKDQQDKVLSNIKTRDFYLGEFHWGKGRKNHKVHSKKGAAPVIDAGRRNGFKEQWCMTYDESRYGSTISKEQIRKYRELYPDYKLITNFRVFKEKRFAQELKLLDGICYEFSVQKYKQRSGHHPGQTKLENIAEAVEWAVDHNKKIFLLIPPGREAPPAKDRRYINAIMQFEKDLKDSLQPEYYNSDELILVPAAYNCIENKLRNVPAEKNSEYANTGMGAALYLIDAKGKEQPANPADYFNNIRTELRKKWPDNRTVNLVFHGHSVPSGYFDTPNVRPFKSYPRLFFKMLKEKYPYAVVNVITTSIGGEKAVEGVKRFEGDVLCHRPDVLFIDYALNDRSAGLKKSKAAWEEMIRKALAEDIKVILLTPTIDIKHTPGKSSEPLNQHASQIRELAAEYNIGLADLLKAFDNVLAEGVNNKELLSNGYNHPNEKAHQIAAEEIMEWF